MSPVPAAIQTCRGVCLAFFCLIGWFFETKISEKVLIFSCHGLTLRKTVINGSLPSSSPAAPTGRLDCVPNSGWRKESLC